MIQFILVGALAGLPAMAGPITFTISQMAVSGSVGTTTFTNELVTFQQVTDIGDIPSASAICGYPCAPQQDGNSVTINGVGTFTLIGESYFFDNAINVIGITYAAGATYLGEEDTSLASYTMTSNFGPTSFGLFSTGVSGVATSGGALTLTWNVDTEPTFQAVVGSQSPTPEPSSFGFTLLGIGALAIAWRKWFRGVLPIL